MLFYDKQVMTIDVPKTGCQTRWAVGNKLNCYQSSKPGHRKLSGCVKVVNREKFRDPVDYWIVIRNPEDRMISAANYLHQIFFRRTQLNVSFDEFVEYHLEQNPKLANTGFFSAHLSFLDVDMPVRVWPFEQHGDMLKELGWTEEIPHRNSSVKKWTRDEIQASKYYQPMMNPYEKDWELYEFALRSRGNDYWTSSI